MIPGAPPARRASLWAAFPLALPLIWRLAFAGALLLLSGCERNEPLYQEQAYIFGTLVDVSIHGEPEPRAREAAGEVMREFQRLHNMLHAWQPSELSEMNNAFAKGESIPVSPELASMLQDATRLSQQSNGLFNPAIGGLVQAWGFHADEFKATLPDERTIRQLVKANPQMSDIAIANGRARSANQVVQVDLGGYAKGYALDRAAELLRARGIRNALINIGGNVLALGQHGKRPWRIGIQHPRKPGALAGLDLLDGEAIGTSGDYQRYFMIGNVRYCHLLDPRTGYPARDVEAATVLTRGPRAGVRSDAASKPLFIAGANGWRKAAAGMGLPEAMLVDGQGAIHLTAAMQKRLEFAGGSARPEVEP